MTSALKFIYCFFGIGKAPKAPGTIASLASIPLLYLLGSLNLVDQMGTFFIVFFSIIAVFSFLAPLVLKETEDKDPSWIVIDEVLGMVMAWTFIQSNNILDIIGIFVLFRVFDIFKIWPSTYFDKEFKHPGGIILDDIFAGIYAGFFYNLLKNIIIQYS